MGWGALPDKCRTAARGALQVKMHSQTVGLKGLCIWDARYKGYLELPDEVPGFAGYMRKIVTCQVQLICMKDLGDFRLLPSLTAWKLTGKASNWTCILARKPCWYYTCHLASFLRVRRVQPEEWVALQRLLAGKLERASERYNYVTLLMRPPLPAAAASQWSLSAWDTPLSAWHPAFGWSIWRGPAWRGL